MIQRNINLPKLRYPLHCFQDFCVYFKHHMTIFKQLRTYFTPFKSTKLTQIGNWLIFMIFALKKRLLWAKCVFFSVTQQVQNYVSFLFISRLAKIIFFQQNIPFPVPYEVQQLCTWPLIFFFQRKVCAFHVKLCRAIFSSMF